MGHEMIRIVRPHIAAVAAAMALHSPGHAQSLARGQKLEAPALGVELWASTDSDKTGVVKLLGRALWDFEGSSKYQGIDYERAWFSPNGQNARVQNRVYLDLADTLEGKWNWTARVGTNGDTVLGSASIRSRDWSKELFVEREIVETPRGLDEGIYYTFAGASLDLVSRAHDTINAMAGFQKFSGRNDRLHLRATYVHVVSSSHGISIQLRARYFHSTHPNEFDYFSPKDFLQVIPVLQMRRFTHSGWMILLAAGYGAQKATGSGWQAARLADFRLESPASSTKLRAYAEVQYSNSSLVGAASNYRYIVGRIGLTKRL
jgi:hypothetical protein